MLNYQRAHNISHTCIVYCVFIVYIYIYYFFKKIKLYTSSTAQGGDGSFKDREPIGEVSCCNA